MKVSELIGAALDYAVARAEVLRVTEGLDQVRWENVVAEISPAGKYSSNWAAAGPIIEREGIDLRQIKKTPYWIYDIRHFDPNQGDEIVRPQGYNGDMVRRPKPPSKYQGMWLARMANSSDAMVSWNLEKHFLSPTPLIAAMRCYVASRLGEEVVIPQEAMEFL